MEIIIESCKGNVTVDSFGLAGEWLEEMQPSIVEVTVDGIGIGCGEAVVSPCDESGAYDAALACRALRLAYRVAQQAEACA